MASFRSSSPVELSSRPSTPPTPRSKINALLAAFDSSSDEEAGREARKAKTAPARSPRSNADAASRLARSSSADEDNNEEEDDAILRPRGKLAARMYADASGAQDVSASADKVGARERVKQLLQAETAKEPPPPNPAQPANMVEEDANDSDADNKDDGDTDDDTVVARRRRLQPRRQPGPAAGASETRLSSHSPSRALLVSSQNDAAAAASAASPGFFVSQSDPASPPAARDGDDGGAEGSDSDLDLPAIKNERFLALVAKKRRERLAKEAEERRKKEKLLAAQQQHDAENDELMADAGDDSDLTDDEAGRRLTQDNARGRPSRKASKKALEEMNRETQRLSRSLQLAHEARTKKKIYKSTLFERFNFKTADAEPLEQQQNQQQQQPLSSSSRPGSPHRSDDVEAGDPDTPPSSPPPVGADASFGKTVDTATVVRGVEDKGKGKEMVSGIETIPKRARHIRVAVPPPTLQSNFVTLVSDDEELDIVQALPRKAKLDAIFARVPANKAKESRPLQALRALAHLDDPDRRAAGGGTATSAKSAKTGLTGPELEALLRQRARQQAKLEREQRLEMLRAKGIHVQTEEEREREMAEVEDMVTRARREAEEIMQRERKAAKKERKARREAAGEADPLAWDDSDEEDEEYQEPKGEGEEVPAVEYSGSEEEEEEEELMEGSGDEEGEEDEAAEEEGEESATGGVFDDEAEAGEGSEEEVSASDDDELSNIPRPKKAASHRARKRTAVVSDDDESDHAAVEATPRPKASTFNSPLAPKTVSPAVPTSVLRSATKTFIPGLPVVGPAGLGLTQIFAGTMDDSQTGDASQTGSASADAFPFDVMPSFDNFPDSHFSQTAREEPAEDMMILDSQPTQRQQQQPQTTQDPETQGVQIHFSQSQVLQGLDSLLHHQHQGQSQEATQLSELMEPTQDGGFRNYTPLKQRFVEAPPSTVETVPLASQQTQTQSQSQAEAVVSDSPIVQRMGRLRRRGGRGASTAPLATVSEDEEDVEVDEFGFGTTTATTSAFTAMRDAAAEQERQRKKKAFDRKKSRAKEMVDEQAEESEDEYAGLGGIDGEDSGDDDDDASVQGMIDDETRTNEVDEAKLAALYADRERANDEKQVEKLFRDITSGMLRRKRGAGDLDLSDSDDDGEARRRMKRRQFAKMQRALLADERISKVAENPRNQAFLRTIEDRASDDEDDENLDLLVMGPDPEAAAGSSGSGSETATSGGGGLHSRRLVPDSQPASAGAPHRQAQQRRRRNVVAGDVKKPTTLGEIRASLSNLLEEPDASLSSVVPATDLDDDDDEEDQEQRSVEDGASSSSNKENRSPRRSSSGHRRRPAANTAAFVDRLTLKRSASSLSTSSTSSSSSSRRLAFAAGSTGSFKVGPAPLLRRATTNSLLSGTSDEGTTTRAVGAAFSGVKTGGGVTGGRRRSGVNYTARESERRAALAEAERRREARRWKGAEDRGRMVGGLFGAGKFE
ncbi:hypothetical protein VTK73DRAFT_9937 [Phialemonium thermophilum]|uniref:DNA replication checkpoint mediator MRC1 domain-containing protein n=1 Tax=Phialemonium thermophilum TaxID=223376 RepID=A0ABR3VZ92_9PEZI